MKKVNLALKEKLIHRDNLSIRVAQTRADWDLAHHMLNEEHSLGAGKEAGDRLCQFVMEDGQIAAIMIWCASAWHLADRDQYIGWDPVTRSKRLKLVVQLRRFLVLEKTRRPNLASCALALGMRELPDSWFEHHGYRPLMAESFSDIESHHGTVYKATNWKYIGDTKGFSQDHTDYYVPNGRPKKLWLKEFRPKAPALMCNHELPEDCKKAETRGGGPTSPLPAVTLKTLRDAFLQVPDPRRPQSRRYHLPGLLGLIALGLLMGGRDVLDIWRKVEDLNESQRYAIGLRRRDKETKKLIMPSYDTLNNILKTIDPVAYAEALTAWLQANQGLLPNSLALDGKSVGNAQFGMIITLCRHEDGRPVGMIPANGKKEDCEVSEARSLLENPTVNLAGSLITADSLHNKTPTIQSILRKGGDYLIATKDNTKRRKKNSKQALSGTPFLK